MSVSVVEKSGPRRLSQGSPAPVDNASAQVEQELLPSDHRQSFREWCVAAGSSVLFHLLLVLALAAVLIALPGPGGDLVIQSAINTGDPKAEQLDSVMFEAPALEAKALEGMGTSDAAAEAALEPRENGVNPAELAGGAMAAMGADGPKVGFFGTRESGVSFVFVVDASGSMDDLASREIPPRTRFMLALKELQKSLADLKTWQKFAVIFYNNGPIPLFAPDSEAKLYPATLSMRTKATKWMGQLLPSGSTHPEDALRQALELRPDVIFFLTDGEIPEEVRDVVKQNNKYKTIVHTVAFSSQEGEAILQAIAKDNRGRYRFVK